MLSARSRRVLPVAEGLDALPSGSAPRAAVSGRTLVCITAATSRLSWRICTTSAFTAAPVDAARISRSTRRVTPSIISRRSGLSAATIQRRSPSAALAAYTHARGSVAVCTSAGGSARCDFAIASAYAFAAMPAACEGTHTRYTPPCRPSRSAAAPAIRSRCRVMSSTSSPPSRPAVGAMSPSSPLRQAASSMVRAAWQSLSISTRSPATCRASVRSTATSSAI